MQGVSATSDGMSGAACRDAWAVGARFETFHDVGAVYPPSPDAPRVVPAYHRRIGAAVARSVSGRRTATSSANGTELWKADATAAGTVLVRDIQLGQFGARRTPHRAALSAIEPNADVVALQVAHFGRLRIGRYSSRALLVGGRHSDCQIDHSGQIKSSATSPSNAYRRRRSSITWREPERIPREAQGAPPSHHGGSGAAMIQAATSLANSRRSASVGYPLSSTAAPNVLRL